MTNQKIAVGDRFIEAHGERSLGRRVTWQVTRLMKKGDKREYAELQPDIARLQSKTISLNALTNPLCVPKIRSVE